MMTGVVRGPVYKIITLDDLGSWDCEAGGGRGGLFQLKRLQKMASLPQSCFQLFWQLQCGAEGLYNVNVIILQW